MPKGDMLSRDSVKKDGSFLLSREEAQVSNRWRKQAEGVTI